MHRSDWFCAQLTSESRRPLIRLFSKSEKNKYEARRRPQVESHVPLEISLFLSGYISALVQRGTLSTSFYSIFYGTSAFR